MYNKYIFDNKEFRKHFLPKMIAVWAIIPAVLNLFAVLNRSWSFALFAIVVTITGLPLFGIYFHQKMQWKSAYVTVCDAQITYFRIVKDGYASDISTYEYMAKETIISAPMQYRISGNNVQLSGNFVERVYKDQEHKQIETKKINSVKIPLYFKKRNELLNALSCYK